MNPAQAERVSRLREVVWAGPHEPAHEVDPAIDVDVDGSEAQLHRVVIQAQQFG